MRIEVTERDILNGVANDDRRCPIALALQRATGERWSVQENLVCQLKTGREHSLPIRVGEFIRDFDDNKNVDPISFNLETTG